MTYSLFSDSLNMYIFELLVTIDTVTDVLVSSHRPEICINSLN